MTDTDERARFDEWWTGRYGPYSIRAEWADTPTDAAWMAWRAQAEEIERLRAALKKIALEDPNPAGSGPAYSIVGRIVRIARAALGGDND